MTTQTILIVDDELAIRRIIQRLLSSRGYEVLTASNADEARALLADRPVDLIISDYVMPGEDGLSFLSQLQKRYPDLLRVMLTGFADVQTVLKAINEAHVEHFIVKPFEVENLLEVVENLMVARKRAQPSAEQRSAPAPPHPDAPETAPTPDEPSPDEPSPDEPSPDEPSPRPDTVMRMLEEFPGIDEVRRNTQGYIVLDEQEGLPASPRSHDSDRDPRPGAPGPSEDRRALPRGGPKQPSREPTFLRNLKREHPDIAEVRRSTDGHILLDDDELETLFETNEYRMPTRLKQPSGSQAKRADGAPWAAKKRPEPRSETPSEPRSAAVSPGAVPLDDWQEPNNTGRKERSSQTHPDSEIVFDDALLKLIGE